MTLIQYAHSVYESPTQAMRVGNHWRSILDFHLPMRQKSMIK